MRGRAARDRGWKGSGGGGAPRDGGREGFRVGPSVGETASARLRSRRRADVPGGRYWVRTSDLFGVNEALSH